MSEVEKRAFEGEVARLKRDMEAAELKSQRRIVELLEQSQEGRRLPGERERKQAENFLPGMTVAEAEALQVEMTKQAHIDNVAADGKTPRWLAERRERALEDQQESAAASSSSPSSSRL